MEVGANNCQNESDSSEVIFEDNGDYIETNLITEDDLKSYRLHVATQEGSKGASLNEALPAVELAKIIYKRRKLKQDTQEVGPIEVDEREKSIEKLKEKIKKKKKKKQRSKSKSPKRREKRQYRRKTPDRKKSPDRSKKSPERRKTPDKKSRSKSPKDNKSKSRSRSKSPKKSSRSRHKSRGRSSTRRRSRSGRRRSHSRRRHKSRSRSRGRSRRHRRKIWDSKSKSRSRSASRGRDDYVKKCRSIQDGPSLPVSRPVERRRRRRSRSRRRSSSSSVERPARGLPASSSYLAIEGPEMEKALVTLYPSATPSIAAPTLDRVRLPTALAQQLFPVSCGSEHKEEESEKQAASVLAIEGPTAKETEEEEKELKAPPTLTEIMQMRIEANKLILKNPNDTAAKNILHEAQILMNRWQAVSARSTGGRYTGVPLATPLPKELLDCHHPLSWARKDMFMNLTPVTESAGLNLMMKMGWSKGQGLGKDGTGDVNPLTLCVKTDRKGLMTDQEIVKKNPAAERGANVVGCNWVIKIVNGKHAVSGLGEIHQHIGRPCPEYIDHPTPSIHQITCKTAWGQFTPPGKAINKKDAKGKAALFALKRILAIEADKYNQTCPEETPTSGVLCVQFKTTIPGQTAKYHANFSDPNKVYINVKNISAQKNPATVTTTGPTLPAGIPHLRPPAQNTIQHRPPTSIQQSIENIISNQRRAADSLTPRAGIKRMPLNTQILQNVRSAPKAPPLMSHRPGLAVSPRHNMALAMRQNMGPPLRQSMGPPPRPGYPGNIRQMIAMATRITGTNPRMPPPPSRPPPTPRVISLTPTPRVTSLPRQSSNLTNSRSTTPGSNP